jgi:hypothetical protein
MSLPPCGRKSETVKTELTFVTPDMARVMLQANTDNRPLRPGAVASLRGAWERGEWKTIHSGIAFGKSGLLLDGQHRLTMIASLPEGTRVPINMTTGMDEGAFDAIDQGNHRSIGDLYNVTPGMAATAAFAAKISNSSSRSGMTPQLVRPYLEWISPEYNALLLHAPTSAVIFSSAPVRLAAVIQIKRGHDRDYILNAYRAMVLSHVDEMPHAARVLAQQRMNGKIASARSNDLFCRALRVFDSHQRQRITTILIKDQAGTLEDVRVFINASMGKKIPAQAGKLVAKPAAHSTRKAA